MTRGDEGMRMLQGIDTRTEMVMDVDQVGRENFNYYVFCLYHLSDLRDSNREMTKNGPL